MSKITYVSSVSLLGSFICLSVLVKKDNFESTKISNFSLKLGVKAWLEGKICPTLNIIHKSVL